jgi:hypothetical protein
MTHETIKCIKKVIDSIDSEKGLPASWLRNDSNSLSLSLLPISSTPNYRKWIRLTLSTVPSLPKKHLQHESINTETTKSPEYISSEFGTQNPQPPMTDDR